MDTRPTAASTASLSPPSEIELRLSADPVFRGDAAELNPEQLLLVAASSCQLLEFLALAARSRVAVISYEDRASASMDERAPPPPRSPRFACLPR